MIHEETQLVLGRGEVYFEPFASGTRVGDGERYVGNTSTFQLSRTIERVERFTSYRGQKVEREGAVVAERHAVQFITDNIDIENVAAWLGEGSSNYFFSQGQVSENIIVRRNRFYQLGKSRQVFGIRAIESLVVKIGATVVSSIGNYEFDSALGRLFVHRDANDIPDGTTLTLEYEWRGAERELATSKASEIYGALRFIATNIAGPQRNYYFPMVRMTPRGQIDLKGDEWQQMPFDVSVMRLTPAIEQIYSDATVSIGGLLDDEDLLAIIELGGVSLDAFPPLEEQLNLIINTYIPAADYSAPL